MLLAPLIAVDIGNSRIKLGQFRKPVATGLPEPEAALLLDGRLPDFDRLAAWLKEEAPSVGNMGHPLVGRGVPHRGHAHPDIVLGHEAAPLRWHIGSVNRPAASRLIDWLHDYRPDDDVILLTSGDLPLAVGLPRPDTVGVDRLLDALAANRLRTSGQPAIVVDVGSAITVDLLDADGVFRGGAILPGIAMSARALHEFTDLLPLTEAAELVEPPAALGEDTVAAIRSGLFWGAVGAVRRLVKELASDRDTEIFLTGGAGPVVAQLMGTSARYVPHLTLAGIVLADAQSSLVDPVE